MSKLTERAVVNQLCLHSDCGFPLPPCQSAYRTGHSTETALVKVQSDILLNMDQQKVTQLILIDLSSAFDRVDHDILLNITNCSFGVSGTALNWLSSYLQSRSQRICINSAASEQFKLDQGVPQGSCLGPVVFTDYSSPVFSVNDQHGKQGHAFADDYQVYCGFLPDSLYSNCESMELCIRDINSWMQGMKLKMNNSKTEYILFGTPQQLAKCTNTAINIGGYEAHALNCVRNLGAYFDKHMSMEERVKFKCRAAYAQLYNIVKIIKYLDQQNTEKLIHALVHSHIDYCNALLIGLPKYLIRKLQLVQNTAARVVYRIGKYDHITPVLKSLHWLPVEFRIKYKICLLTFNSLHGHGPEYMSEMLTHRSIHYGLRSQDDLKLDVPRTKRKTLGDRAFKVAAPKLELPSQRCSQLQQCQYF